ncbi:thioredoxin domain-containing protein [Streptococcus sp. HMSC072G04]|uniref:thioredoxin domain-containing protein n=1 Tax=Streptococcus TaxID=1301 RepID=UPI00210B3E94|nr:thioredoxin domain-containing protein [Streptococcus sp. HMSC072G04]
MTYVKKIHLSEVQEKIDNKEDFLLYIGRESCPYCQKFAPKLAVAIQKTNQTVYYLDNDSKERKDITAFAHDMNIKTVPNLSSFKKGSKENYLKKGSKSSIEEIMDLLTQ